MLPLRTNKTPKQTAANDVQMQKQDMPTICEEFWLAPRIAMFITDGIRPPIPQPLPIDPKYSAGNNPRTAVVAPCLFCCKIKNHIDHQFSNMNIKLEEVRSNIFQLKFIYIPWKTALNTLRIAIATIFTSRNVFCHPSLSRKDKMVIRAKMIITPI